MKTSPAKHPSSAIAKALHSRPYPPEHLTTVPEEDEAAGFAPAPEIDAWVRSVLLDESGPLFNPEHLHLVDVQIGYLWTNAQNARQGKQVVGQCEKPFIQGNTWLKGRMRFQLESWFGAVPDILITLDAPYADDADDARFCSLLEHELLHIGVLYDRYGAPRFTAEGGLMTRIQGHDVEEFVSVVRRYGAGAASPNVMRLAQAAMSAPTIAPVRIAEACGTCLK